MNFETVGNVAVIYSDEPILKDGASALQVIVDVMFESKLEAMVVNKEAISEDFFKLSSGIAGEIAQKISNYGVRVAVYGDYSKYVSKPLNDFIRECNQGRLLCFCATREEAIEKVR